MLLDPDGDREIAVFPALPTAWIKERVAFTRLAARGGILVSGECSPAALNVTLDNRSATGVTRTLQVRLPAGTTVLRLPEAQVVDGWAVLPDIRLEPGQVRRFDLPP